MGTENPFLAPANPMQLLQQAQQVPEELQPELRGITRQQQLANMLTQQAMQPANQGQMVSGRYVAPSFFQSIAPMVNAYLGQRASEQADVKQAALAEKLREGGNAEMQRFNELLGTGTPEERKTALQYAQGAKYSQALRNVANEMMKPQKLSEGDKLVMFGLGGQSIDLASGGQKLQSDIKYAAQLLGLPEDSSKWTPQQQAAVKAEVIAKENAKAQKNIISISQNTEKSYGSNFAEGLAKQDLSLYNNAQKAPEMLQNVEQQQALLSNPNLFTGAGANWQLQAAKVADALNLGGKDTAEKVANTQRFYAGRAGATLDAISGSGLGAGNGFTNKDLDFLRDAKMGNITYSKEALQQQLQIEAKAARIFADKWNSRLKEIPQSATAPTGVKSVTLPPMKSAPPAGVDSKIWDAMTPEERKAFGG